MRTAQPLNDGWLYRKEYCEGMEQAKADESAFQSVRLPHTNLELPFNSFNETDFQFVSCYRRRIRWQPRPGRRAFLRFEGAMAAAKVYYNGAPIGEHLGGYTPFSFEITGLATGAEDVLAVVVDSRERDDIPPFGYVIDYLTYGGIYREAWLEETGEIYLENTQVKPVKSGGIWRVGSDLYFDNAAGISGQVLLRMTLTAPGGLTQTEDRPVLLSGETKQTVHESFDSKGVLLWDIDSPNLYDLKIELLCAERLADIASCRFGFREAEFTADGFFLNGRLVKLRGLNRHQCYPYVGYAMPKRAQESDADLLKNELGVNLARTSHYPQSKHFLNRCDELGLLVFEEIPGWQHIGGETWKENTLTALKEMIERDWNHPSIVLWGVRINESQDDDAFYRETNALAHSLDSTRQTGGVRNFAGSRFYEDVYTYNDFVHSGKNEPLKNPKDVVRGRAPYLVTEHNGHMFPTKQYDSEEKRVEHALRHLRVLDRMYADGRISGAVGWCMSDYNTHRDFGSGDKICYHGVTDQFRLPKLAAAAYRSQAEGEPFLEVASGMHHGERSSSELSRVYVFTNCDSVRLYKNDAYIGEYYPGKDEFANLPHPPVVITDFIGGLLEQNEGFSKREAERLKRIFAAVVKYGDKSLPLRYKLAMGYAMLKNRIPYSRAVDLFMRYVAGWGSEATEYRFEGMKNGTCVAAQTKGATHAAQLRLTPQTRELAEGDTYDVCRVAVEVIDRYGEIVRYTNEAVRVSVSGAGERIGPELLPLTGGSAAFWVKTNGTGEIVVSVESERFGTQALKLSVVRECGG